MTSSTPSWRPACRTSTCRSSTSRADCWPGCAGGVTATASSAAFSTYGGPRRSPRSGRRSSSGIPGRRRRTTTDRSRSCGTRHSTGRGSSCSPPRTGRGPPTCRPGRRRARVRAPARVHGAAGLDHRPPTGRAGRQTREVLVDSPGSDGPFTRHTGDRRVVPGAGHAPGGWVRGRGGDGHLSARMSWASLFDRTSVGRTSLGWPAVGRTGP